MLPHWFLLRAPSGCDLDVNDSQLASEMLMCDLSVTGRQASYLGFHIFLNINILMNISVTMVTA